MSRKIVHVPQHKEVASTPSTPDSGYSKIYVKSDGLWYYLDDAGSESLLGGGGTWGSITGTLSDQTDLQDALDDKVNETRAIDTNANSGLDGGGNLTADRTLALNVSNLTSYSEDVAPDNDIIALYNASATATQRVSIGTAVARSQTQALSIQPFSRTTNITVLAESEEGITCPFDAKITRVLYKAWTPGGRTGLTDIRLKVDGVAVTTTGVTLDVNGEATINPTASHGVTVNSLITVEVVSIQSAAPVGLTVTVILTRL